MSDEIGLHLDIDPDGNINKAKAGMDKLTDNIGQAEEKSKSFKAQIREMTEQLLQMEQAGQKGTAAYDQLQLKLSKAKDMAGDLAQAVALINPDDRAKAFQALGNTIVGGFQAGVGAMAVFTGDNKALNELLLKSMAILQGLQGIQAIVDAKKQAGALASIFVKKQEAAASVEVATATEGEAAATGAATVATEGATTAFKGLRGALLATGIGAIVLIIGTLIANWDKLKKSFLSAFPEFAKSGKVLQDTFYGVKDAVIGTLKGLFDAVVQSVKSYIEIYKIGWATIKKIVSDPIHAGDALSDAWQSLKTEGSKFVAAWKDVATQAQAGWNEGIKESNEKDANEALKNLIEKQKRVVEVMQAGGQETYALQRKILQEELSLLDKNSEDYKTKYADKLKEIEVLDVAHHQKTIQAKADEFKYRAQLDDVHHKDSYNDQLKALQEELALYKKGSDGYKKKLEEINLLEQKHKQQSIDTNKDLLKTIDDSQRSAREKELFAIDEMAAAKKKAGADETVLAQYVADEKAKINKKYDDLDKADLLTKLKDYESTELLILQNAHASAQAIHDAKAAMFLAEANMRKKNGEDAVKVDAETTAKLKANDKELIASKMALFDKYVQAEQQIAGAVGDILETRRNNELAQAGNNQAKQEQINRKYFEDSKKLQTAQAIINGLVALTKIAATNAGDPFLMGVLLAAQATATAATVAKIQSTQYTSTSSGGGDVSTSVPAPAAFNTTENLINRQAIAQHRATQINNQTGGGQTNNGNANQPAIFKTYILDSDLKASQERMDKIARLSSH